MIINVIFFETIFTTNAVSFFFNQVGSEIFSVGTHKNEFREKNTCMNEKYGFNKKDENIA